MSIGLYCFSSIKSLSFIFILFFLAFLTIGGCSENNGGGIDGVGDPPPAPQAGCSTIPNPCTSTNENEEGTIVQCTTLNSSACAVDLEDVLKQVDPNGTELTGDSAMWIELWGSRGGHSDKGVFGGASGYAITTTTVNDIKAINNGSSEIYYFLGSQGIDAAERCGGGGGVGSIVTTEDLALNPTSEPTQTTPPVLLAAGSGGGGAASNRVGACLTSADGNSGSGGIAIATTGADGQGAGTDSTNNITPLAGGGNKDGMGKGGNDDPGSGGGTSGSDGFGGLGGVGGTGPGGCLGPGANNFINTPVQLSFKSGRGGNGGGKRGSCAAGGGAGGGGYGGGGGGKNGDELTIISSGGGGGSFAIQSTKSSTLAPTTFQPNPCGGIGCARITFERLK